MADAPEPRELEIADVRRDIEELRGDITKNAKELVGITDVGDLIKHLKLTLWPTIEAIGDRISELADVVDTNEEALLQLAQEEGDLLTQESAEKILNVFVIAAAIATALEQRITPADPPTLKDQIAQFRGMIDEATALVTEATMATEDPEEEEEDDNE